MSMIFNQNALTDDMRDNSTELTVWLSEADGIVDLRDFMHLTNLTVYGDLALIRMPLLPTIKTLAVRGFDPYNNLKFANIWPNEDREPEENTAEAHMRKSGIYNQTNIETLKFSNCGSLACDLLIGLARKLDHVKVMEASNIHGMTDNVEWCLSSCSPELERISLIDCSGKYAFYFLGAPKLKEIEILGSGSGLRLSWLEMRKLPALEVLNIRGAWSHWTGGAEDEGLSFEEIYSLDLSESTKLKSLYCCDKDLKFKLPEGHEVENLNASIAHEGDAPRKPLGDMIF